MDKGALRELVLLDRAARSPSARAEVADAIASHLLAEAVSRADRVAAYLSMGTEPGTGPLITGLLRRGAEIIVPVGAPGNLLDWVRFEPTSVLRRSPIGIPEPDGPRLGTDALDTVGLVIVPALAVDHHGYRLGRGAGYYDRALVGVRAPVCAVVHAAELMASVPHEDHDVPVTMAVTEAGVFRVSPGATPGPAGSSS